MLGRGTLCGSFISSLFWASSRIFFSVCFFVQKISSTYYLSWALLSVQFRRSVVSDSLQPHELQHSRPLNSSNNDKGQQHLNHALTRVTHVQHEPTQASTDASRITLWIHLLWFITDYLSPYTRQLLEGREEGISSLSPLAPKEHGLSHEWKVGHSGNEQSLWMLSQSYWGALWGQRASPCLRVQWGKPCSAPVSNSPGRTKVHSLSVSIIQTRLKRTLPPQMT